MTTPRTAGPDAVDIVIVLTDDGSVPAPPPANENQRLQALREYEILDTQAEQAYDDITYLASQICAVPIALVSLVDEDRQWFKSKVGLDVEETPRDQAFCAHAILDTENLLIVRDATTDPRFATNPLVLEQPSIRFYAGAPLTTKDGHALGTLCVIDRQPRELTPAQEGALAALARQVTAQLELRRLMVAMRRASEKLKRHALQQEDYQRRLEENYAALHVESLTDALTGVRNRRAFEERLNEEASRARRSGFPLSLLMLDVDEFKTFNDRNGHQAGDEVLRAVAQLAKDCSRAHDFVARYGGDEFIAILPDTDAVGAQVLAERCRAAIEGAHFDKYRVTVTIGAATHQGDALNAQSLLARVDNALYLAKEAGRNGVVHLAG